MHLTELSLSKIDKQYVWHPYTQMREWLESKNRIIVRGEGFSLVDDQGRKYLDGTASMWCNVWGHDQNPVVKAMQTQLNSLQHSTLFGLGNESSVVLAQKLVKVAKGLDKVFYTDNGSTAIEAAMKMALQYWRNRGRREKKEFLALEHAYHGDTIGAMSVGYIEKFFGAYKPLLSPKVHRLPTPLLHGSKFNDANNLVERCLAKAEGVLKAHGNKSAALVMESGAQIAGGAIVYPPRFQSELALLCHKYKVLLILDEIATGFGRLGNMIEYIAQETKPDIACFGKALTGGYFPLAAVLASDSVYAAFLGDYSDGKQLYHGHTFTGHPVGCAAAIANMKLYEKRNLVQKISESAKLIASRLGELNNSPVVADIRHKGMLAGIELEKRGRPILTVGGERINYFVMKEALRRGVYLRSLGNIMVVIPPLAIGSQDLHRIMDVHIEVIREIERLVLQ